MDNIRKVYVSQVKAILPVWGRNERKFVKKLHENLSDYCEDNNINVIDELYKGFGTPQEIVFEYISLMEPQEISKRINTAKYIKILVVSFIFFAFFVAVLLGMYVYGEYLHIQQIANTSIEQTVNYD